MSDTSGEEWEQPADIVLLCAFSFFNVQMMLLSGIGKPYDPQNRGRVLSAATTPHQSHVEREPAHS